ncbi:endolytic transglycosylase MltG [Desulfurivibrio dismutans]|uniref:endolytic transglycosylase MltG n=1 Tax=Desulfurivibrio dismutans TaxID=1398908 RepID=UPI0023DCCF88|nr:endolytic transglycosylase MltG [Desulfurivibrio alkaliphilus]MDF1613762.1 endolytic transglycosylase MltG [Desulfurivibrio alkaliphilus]
MELDRWLSGPRNFRRRPALWLGLLAGLTALLWFWAYAMGTGPARSETLVYIVPGSPFSVIERTLVEAEVLRPDRRFRWLAAFGGYRGQLKAGEYAVAAGASPRQILQLLASGRTVRRQVTIPEGANLYQVARLLGAQQLLAEESFVAFAAAPATPALFAVDSPTLEGWLFPDTYFFTRGQSKEEITAVMVRRARAVLDELLAEMGNDVGLNRREIMTLASIVEKETGRAEERAKIAGVFFNRLEKGMRLQTDPTVIYGLQSFDRRLTRQDLRTPTPYNTYTIHGLPPGPIANPGREAIAAVLNPEDTDYLYFVSRNDGSHHFSTNLREHNRAVNLYQR